MDNLRPGAIKSSMERIAGLACFVELREGLLKRSKLASKSDASSATAMQTWKLILAFLLGKTNTRELRYAYEQFGRPIEPLSNRALQAKPHLRFGKIVEAHLEQSAHWIHPGFRWARRPTTALVGSATLLLYSNVDVRQHSIAMGNAVFGSSNRTALATAQFWSQEPDWEH